MVWQTAMLIDKTKQQVLSFLLATNSCFGPLTCSPLATTHAGQIIQILPGVVQHFSWVVLPTQAKSGDRRFPMCGAHYHSHLLNAK